MRRLALVAFGLAAAALPASAQPPADPAPVRRPIEVRLGARLGAFEMINSEDSYDAVFGEPMPQLGIAFEVQPWRGLYLVLTYDYGEVDGEQVLPTDPPRSTGDAETLTYQPLALTAGWVFRREAPWKWHLGAGATLLDWEDDAARSTSGSDSGWHAVAGLRREPGRWALGGELRYSTIPDAIGEGGVSALFDEDDLGGIALHFVALYRLK